MASTGTYNYLATAGTIIEEALRKLGVVEEGDSASSTQISDAMPALEMYLKSLGNKGLMIWKVNRQSVTTVNATSTYSYSSTYKFTEITNVLYRDSDGEDTILKELTRDEFDRLSDKDQAGTPTQYWWDKSDLPGGDNIHLWPVPDTTAAGSGEAIIVVGILPIEDADDASPDGTYDIDVPSEYYEMIAYGLAVRLAPSYGLPVSDRRELRSEYNEIKEETMNFDRETGSLFLRPNSRGSW